MKRVVFCLLFFSSSCGNGIVDFELTDRGVVLGNQHAMYYCPLERPLAVGSDVYAPNPHCEILLDNVQVASGWSAGNDAMVYHDALSNSEATKACYANYCRELFHLDLDTRKVELIATNGPHAAPQSAGPWVVWIDVRHDKNGLCFYPAGDEDCAIDLYAFNLHSRSEHRLTTSSTVFPKYLEFPHLEFSLEGTQVAYVDRRDTAPDCYLNGELRALSEHCRTTLRLIDLEKKTDQLVAAPELGAFRPQLGNGGLAWLEYTGERNYRVSHMRVTDLSARQVLLEPVSWTLAYRVDGDWLLYAGSRAIEGINAATGERRVLSEPEEKASSLDARNGLVLWTDEDRRAVSIYELGSGKRSTLMELP
jgi:hypothetical protein